MKYINNILKSKYGSYIIIFILVIAINGIYLSINNLTNTDEFSSLAAPAILAGKDWSALSSVAGFHGYGVSILLTPFFMFISEGTVLYKISLAICLCFRIICTCVSFWIVRNIFEISETKSLVVALVCNFGMLSSDDGAALSSLMEVPLTLITICFIFFMAKGILDKKNIFFVFSGIVLAYGSMVHSRILIVYFSVVCLLLLYFFLYRKKKNIAIIYLGISFVIAFVIYLQVDTLIMDLVYMTNNGAELITTTSGIATTRITRYLSWLFDFQLFQSFVGTFFSLLGTFTFYSFGTIWIFIYANIKYIIDNVRKKDLNIKEQLILFIGVFGIINFFAMNVSIALSSCGQIPIGNYRWLTYARYAMPYAWVIAMSGLSICYKNVSIIKKLLMPYSVTTILLIKFFFEYTVDLLTTSGYEMGYTFFNRFFYETGDTSKQYFASYFIYVFLITIICIYLGCKKKINHIVSIYLLLSMIIYVEMFNFYSLSDEAYDEIFDASYEIVKSDELAEYCSEYFISGSTRYKYFMQVAAADKVFIPIEEIDFLELGEGVLFSDRPLDSIDNKVYFVELEEKEYVYTYNEILYNEILKMKSNF